MTQEEKAKAYDEAIKRAKELLEIGVKDTRDKRVVLSFFPELKESEDERIRKALIRFHTSTIDIDGIKGNEIVAWLEKQGEKNHVEWNREDEQNLNAALSYINDEYLRKWLKYAIYNKYEKHTKWSEEDEELVKWSINNLTELKDRFGEEYGKVGKCIDWLKSLKDKVQPKQEWSKEDEGMLNHCIGAIHIAGKQVCNSYTAKDKVQMRIWLKSLKQRMEGEE